MPSAIKEKQKLLDRVAKELRASDCPLRQTARQAVPGEGNAKAKIVFIGEAPGRNEDETGRPFVGAAGKVLSSLLAEAGLERADVFITSIEKFRPPNNRDPKPAEIMACFPYLERQLKIIKPKVIVTLGRHALKRMLEWDRGKTIRGDLAMAAYHGKSIKMKGGFVLFPVHHPAAMLYNRSLEKGLRKAFKKMAKLV